MNRVEHAQKAQLEYAPKAQKAQIDFWSITTSMHCDKNTGYAGRLR